MMGALLLLSTTACFEPRVDGWERLHPDFSAPIYSLIQDPANPQIWLAGCGRQVVGRGPSRGGLLRSDDGGKIWLDSTGGLPAGAEVVALSALGKNVLLAGTRSQGIYQSTDGGRSWRLPGTSSGGIDWSLIELQALAVLPGEPPAIVAGSNGQGVWVSEDGGQTWQERNQGLSTLTIQTLAVERNKDLIAGAWFGGLFVSGDRGRTWRKRSTELSRATVATVRFAEERLWIGLQGGGLLTADLENEAQPYAEKELKAAGVQGVQAVEAFDGHLVVGTDCCGVALGAVDGPLRFKNDGLGSWTVTAAGIDRQDPKHIVLGTWSGLYGARNGRPWGFMVGAFLLILLTLDGIRRWRRSLFSRITGAYHQLASESVGKAVEKLYEKIHPELGHPDPVRFIKGLAWRLEWSTDPVRQELIPLLRSDLDFVGLVGRLRQHRSDSVRRHQEGALLAERAALFEGLAEIEPFNPDFLRLMALQARIISISHQATSLAHLSPLADDFGLYVEKIQHHLPSRALIDPVAAAVAHKMALLHTQLARLPPEDRALVLGRALSEILLTLEEVKRSRRGHVGGLILLEILRQILIDSLRDLRQRAEIQLDLISRTLPGRREAIIAVDLCNTGQGHAEKVELKLETSPELRVLTPTQHLPGLLKQQTARLEFLVEHLQGERVRLSFELRWNDLEQNGRSAQFADVVEVRRPIGRVTTFRPLRPNPYVVGRPLRESDVFIGREETFARIASSLQGANQDNVVVLMGQRRMGKTSILRQLRHRLEPFYIPLLVDLQGILGRGEAAFLWEIATAMCDGLEQLGRQFEEPSSASFTEDPGHYFRNHFLRPLCRTLGEHRLLIIFDEFEVLAERIASGDLSPRILPYFRSLMQHEEAISFLFAGTHRLDQLTGDYWGALFNLAVYLEVGHLHPKEVGELFLRPTRGHFEIDTLALDKAVRNTGGHPHFCQLVARELVELRNEERLDYVTIQDINRVSQRVIQKGQLHIAYLWDEASQDERLLLLAVTELLAQEGGATLETARALIESRCPKAADRDLALALRILLRKELLGAETGRIYLRIDLLRYWLEQQRNLADTAWRC